MRIKLGCHKPNESLTWESFSGLTAYVISGLSSMTCGVAGHGLAGCGPHLAANCAKLPYLNTGALCLLIAGTRLPYLTTCP
jgi:hypothetical protein